MNLFAMLHEQTPDPVKVVVAALTFFGVSLSDMNSMIQLAVGVATLAYIITKTVQLWRNKGKQNDET